MQGSGKHLINLFGKFITCFMVISAFIALTVFSCATKKNIVKQDPPPVQIEEYPVIQNMPQNSDFSIIKDKIVGYSGKKIFDSTNLETAKVLGVTSPLDQLKVLVDTKNWIHILWSTNVNGWISKDDLGKQTAKIMYLDPWNALIYSNGSKDSPIVTDIMRGDKLFVLTKKADWAKVSCGDMEGWIQMSQLTTNKIDKINVTPKKLTPEEKRQFDAYLKNGEKLSR